MEPVEYIVTSTSWLLPLPQTDNITSWNATTSGAGGGRQSFPDDGHTRVLLYAIIFLLAIAGNALVIATLAHDRRMRTVTNLFLLNLAVSDLLLAVLCMPFTLIPTLLKNFIFGKAMCILIRYMQGAINDICAYVLLNNNNGNDNDNIYDDENSNNDNNNNNNSDNTYNDNDNSNDDDSCYKASI